MYRKAMILMAMLLFSFHTLAQPGRVIRTFPSPTPHLADLTWDGTYLYLLGLTDHIIYKLDPNNGNVLGTISTGITGALGLTYRNGHFWVSVVSDNTLRELDANGQVIRTVSIPSQQAIGIEWDGQTFRVADSGAPDEEILQVDTLGNLLSSFLFPGDSPFGLTWDGNTIWCADNNLGGVATVYQFDPVTGNIITSFPCPNGGGAVNGLAWDGQYLWVADQSNDLIYQVEGNPLPQFGVIAGYIRDGDTGAGIGAVRVLGALTNSSGYFVADSLPPGFYSLSIVVAGFEELIIDSLEVIAGDTTLLDTALTPVGEPFEFLLRESDGDEWHLRTYRDSTWRFYEVPLQRFRGTGSGFLDSPLVEFVLHPIGGGISPTTEIADWLDALVLADSLIDDFEDGNLNGWTLDIALNGSYLDTLLDAFTPDSSDWCLYLKHGNPLGQGFFGLMIRSFSPAFSISPEDSLRFWLRGTPEYEVTGISPHPGGSLPQKLSLKQNYPNPFNPATVIEFTVPAFTGKIPRVTLAVYDLLGRKITTLINKSLTPGYYQLRWNGTDARGKKVGSGVYLYELKVEQQRLVKKMVLLR
ncbi:MAG: T9SS C-terminal target domain-containing protein [Calditrichaeota bacterium]|nr:MAG: T9SS C-terminal target domain-containing protein [Calditrichota bacterium]